MQKLIGTDKIIDYSFLIYKGKRAVFAYFYNMRPEGLEPSHRKDTGT